MENIILIAILCIVIGVLAGALMMNKSKNKQSNKKDTVKNKVKIKEKKPKMEFSKLLLALTGSVALLIIVAALTMSYQTQTTDVFAYLIPSIFGLLTIAYPFYYVKAKAENLLKIRGSLGEEAAEFARKAMKKDDEY
ncbi:hypothetical protein ABE073_03755 [Lederbergia citrisecunda]|uniref:hypothetical protein n=1 Tax=Lederbergia citrisecunda TaxID=2833583 RepID=UPI003D286F31